MRTIRTKVYKFNELNEDAKQNAISTLYDLNVNHDWWESIYEDAKQVEISIDSFDIDRASYCNIEFIDSPEYTAHKIVDNHGETCDTYVTATDYLKERDELIDTWPIDEVGELENEGDLDSDLDDLDDNFRKELSECYLSMLRNEYEYQTSEAGIIESIEANDYEFTADGKLF